MGCKAVTAILFTVVDPPLKPNRTSISVPENPLQTSLSISSPPMVVTHILPSIPPPLQLNSLQSCILNSSSQSSSDRNIRYRADLCIARRRTGIVEAPTGRHGAFVINVIKGRYVF